MHTADLVPGDRAADRAATHAGGGCSESRFVEGFAVVHGARGNFDVGRCGVDDEGGFNGVFGILTDGGRSDLYLVGARIDGSNIGVGAAAVVTVLDRDVGRGVRGDGDGVRLAVVSEIRIAGCNFNMLYFRAGDGDFTLNRSIVCGGGSEDVVEVLQLVGKSFAL